MFLIISSSVYPAILSGIQNKEIALMADAVAQLQERNSSGDSSGYRANVHATEIPSSTPSSTPTTSAPHPLRSTDTASNNNKDITAQAVLGSTARPSNNIVNTKSFYDIVFLTTTSGAIKRIQVTFPAGTIIPNIAFFNEAEKCVPGGNCTVLTGSAIKSGQTITYTVTNAVNVPAGTRIRLEFSNINNPLNPSANYKVTVTTRNAANAIIDGPSQSTVYSIKQIVPITIQREGSPVNVPPDSFSVAFADCLGKETVAGGGYGIDDIDDDTPLRIAEETAAIGPGISAWIVVAFNPDTIEFHSFRASAECIPPLS